MPDSWLQSLAVRRDENAGQLILTVSEKHENSICCQCIAPTFGSVGPKARTASMEVTAVSGVVPGSHPLLATVPQALDSGSLRCADGIL